MFNRARLAVAVWGLVTFSAPAWAQQTPPVPTLDVAFCCKSVTAGTGSQPIGRNCTTPELTPSAVNTCTGTVFSCGSGNFSECEPAATGGKKDCSCSTFSN